MKLSKRSKKLALIVAVFFFAHLILQFGFLLWGFATGMAHFDNPNDNTLETKSKLYLNIYTVLSFPLLSVLDRMPLLDIFPSFFGYIPFILNSALWTLVFYFLIRKRFER